MTPSDDVALERASSAEVPNTPESLSPEWVTSVLEAAGVARGAVVTAVHVVGDIGTGQAARNVRFGLRWDAEDRPASVVGKFPSDDDGARATLEATGGYWKEWFFYDQVASTVDMRVPVCHAALFDAVSSDFVLLMEDLSDSTPGDQLIGLSADQTALAVEQSALLHGPRYGDPRLEQILAGGAGTTLAEAGPFCEEMYASVLPEFLERFGATVEPDALDLIERTAPYVARWFQGTGAPLTLVHQDLRADNLLFGSTSAAPSVVTVDFQSLTAGVGATDVAYLIGGSVADPAERAAIERDLLGQYRSRLHAYGIERSADALWDDYRHGSLWGVIMTVLSSIGAARTDRGEVMFALLANRHAGHASELDALARWD